VLKDPKQRRFFKSNDLYELFTLNEGTSDRTETSAIFEGTNSDVRPHSKRRRSRPRDAQPARGAFKPIKKEEPSKEHVRATVQKIYESPKSKSSLSESERERIMRRVREISQKISGQSSGDVSEKQKRNKKKREAKLEGQRIPHLVKADVYKNRCHEGEGGEEATQAQSSQEQDSYVLSKLFKKSGVHSAVQHDRIMEGGEEDFALIEGEAERVAKLAVEELRRSRRQCFRADAGIPTWTGANGAVANRPRFGATKAKKSGSSIDEAAMFSGSVVAKGKLLTSAELLAKIKQRNRYLASGDDLFQPDGVSSSTLESPSAEQLELLSDIRNFVAFQAAADGRATTDELLERFRRRLPPKQSPLFKAMLTLVCSFHRNSDGKGVWTLKPDLA
jgi:DNA excision repair protein ERCC-6